MLCRIAFTLTTAILLCAPAAAADKKPAKLRDFPFWTAPKRPHAPAFVPGLQAALMLTPDQEEKIEAACRDTVDKPEARTKETAGPARERLHALVADILTAEQKKLIETINDAYARVSAEVGEEFQPQYAAAKGNPDEMARVRKQCAEAIAEAFEKKLDAVLTREQRDAVKKAAEAERNRPAGDKGKKK